MADGGERRRPLGEELSMETLLMQEEGGSGVVPAIYQASLFTFDSFASMRATLEGRDDRYVYSRGRNPTVEAFERKVAELEGAQEAVAFASGMAAISAVILGSLSSGDRIVCVRNVYPDAHRLMTRFLDRFGIAVEFVDGTDTDAVVAALQGAAADEPAGAAGDDRPAGASAERVGAASTGAGRFSPRRPARLLYLESPTSQLFELQDVAALAAAARDVGALTVIDNSWGTPLGARPLAAGADLVIHSASKYLSGHSDVVAGVVAGSSAHIGRLRGSELMMLGGKLSPGEAWLLLRGLRTLPVRLERHARSALAVARFLQSHPEVLAVNYPGLPTHPQHDLFRRYFRGGSGLLSFELSDERAVEPFVDALRLFRLGVSWGGFESLVYPSLLGHLTGDESSFTRFFDIPRALVRIHVGLEDPADLIADLTQAFEVARKGGAPLAV